MKRKTAVFLTILLFLTACTLPNEVTELLITPTSTEPAVPPTATAVPQGYSRQNPHPGHAPLTFDNWEVTVLDSVRGEKAFNILQAANMFNDPPPEGMEYLLVKYRVRSLFTGADEESLGLHITGDANRIHYSFDASAVPPDPILETYLPGTSESEGWEAYLIQQGEGELLVLVDDFINFDQPPHYIALEEGARVQINEELLHSLTPTTVGTDPAEPALVGQVATTEDWQLSILEVYSGEEAWQRILEANQFNDPPESGMVYVLVKIRLRYIGLEEAGERISLHSDLLALLDAESQVYDLPSVVEPEPALEGHLFPGGSIDGWAIFQAPEARLPELRLLFQPRQNLVDNLRYLSLVDYGR